jgi:hypothetical protein
MLPAEACANSLSLWSYQTCDVGKREELAAQNRMLRTPYVLHSLQLSAIRYALWVVTLQTAELCRACTAHGCHNGRAANKTTFHMVFLAASASMYATHGVQQLECRSDKTLAHGVSLSGFTSTDFALHACA